MQRDRPSREPGAGVNLGKAQMFLQKGTPDPKGCAVYLIVGDADQLYAFHRANGVDVAQEIGDREYAIRDYVVRERVDVPVRLEKHLAALLQDLAKHKHMSVSSCLEEMLLHTNEGVGPHTQTTIQYISELKKKHGIDYDSHASYRFVEE